MMNINPFSKTVDARLAKRGRPRAETPKKFRNVAVPLETHPKIKALADAEGRTIAKQLRQIIEASYDKILWHKKLNSCSPQTRQAGEIFEFLPNE